MPVVVGDDWQAVLLWKALFDAGVYTNVAIHPAVPPGGALLRTSLMATHEREHLDARPRRPIARVIQDFPDLPRASRGFTSPGRGSFRLVRIWTRRGGPEKAALSDRRRADFGDLGLTLTAPTHSLRASPNASRGREANGGELELDPGPRLTPPARRRREIPS